MKHPILFVIALSFLCLSCGVNSESSAAAAPEGKEEKTTSVRKAKTLIVNQGTAPGDSFTVTLPYEIPLNMRWCPPGTFIMGSSDDDFKHAMERRERKHSEYLREITLSHGFWIAETELNAGQFMAILMQDKDGEERFNKVVGLAKIYDKDVAAHENRESLIQSAVNEVFTASWDDAISHCQILNRYFKMDGWEFRLPTEAEWEYACLAGEERTAWDTKTGPNFAQFRSSNNPPKTPQPPATREPNPWGIYDMRGNLDEWVMDWYDQRLDKGRSYGNYRNLPAYNPPIFVTGTDPRGPLFGTEYIYTISDKFMAEAKKTERQFAHMDKADQRPAPDPETTAAFVTDLKIIKGGNHLDYWTALRASARKAEDHKTETTHIGYRFVLAPKTNWAGWLPPKKPETEGDQTE